MNATDIFRKLLLLIIIIVLSKYNILAGLVGVFIYIYFFENKVREGMRPNIKNNNLASSGQNNPINNINNYKQLSNKEDTETDQNVSNNNVQKNVDLTYVQAKMNEEDKKQKTNKNINSSSEFRRNYCINNKLIKDNKPVIDVHESFPQLVYKSDPCDPCDNNCDFDIVSTNEGLTVSENLRGIDSNLVSVNR